MNMLAQYLHMTDQNLLYLMSNETSHFKSLFLFRIISSSTLFQGRLDDTSLSTQYSLVAVELPYKCFYVHLLPMYNTPSGKNPIQCTPCVLLSPWLLTPEKAGSNCHLQRHPIR